MKDFRWNGYNKATYWNDLLGIEVTDIISDKSFINNPGSAKINSILDALCRVVSELMEIEENRNDS
jgi:hypothetical protein